MGKSRHTCRSYHAEKRVATRRSAVARVEDLGLLLDNSAFFTHNLSVTLTQEGVAISSGQPSARWQRALLRLADAVPVFDGEGARIELASGKPGSSQDEPILLT